MAKHFNFFKNMFGHFLVLLMKGLNGKIVWWLFFRVIVFSCLAITEERIFWVSCLKPGILTKTTFEKYFTEAIFCLTDYHYFRLNGFQNFFN